MTNNTAKHLAVIGAGSAGLVMAKTMLQAGLQVTVFEMGTQIGGTWVYQNDNNRAYIYRNLHINTAKRYSRFSDFDFAPDVPAYPSHWDMHRYLREYASHFGVSERIRFRAEVIAVRPEDAGWSIGTRDGTKQRFDAVAVCTSPFNRPRDVAELRDSFAGDYLHSAHYREPEPFARKRVCVIGAGNSAVDIASDICTTAARTVLVARSGVIITPQYVFGMSFNELVVHYLQRWWLPSRLRRRIVRQIVRAVHGPVTKLGFKSPTHRVHPTSSATIVADINFGRVAVKPSVAAIAGRTIQFSDGTSEDFDAVIAATGFDMEFPFVPPEVAAVRDNRIDLYKRIVVPGWPGLYFVGMINLDTPINFACERQARWIREIETGGARLPTKEAMLADIAAKQAWVERYYGHAMRHTVQEESKPYYAELEREILRSRYPDWLATLLAPTRYSP